MCHLAGLWISIFTVFRSIRFVTSLVFRVGKIYYILCTLSVYIVLSVMFTLYCVN